jgi:hypothetical protein
VAFCVIPFTTAKRSADLVGVMPTTSSSFVDVLTFLANRQQLSTRKRPKRFFTGKFPGKKQCPATQKWAVFGPSGGNTSLRKWPMSKATATTVRQEAVAIGPRAEAIIASWAVADKRLCASYAVQGKEALFYPLAS